MQFHLDYIKQLEIIVICRKEEYNITNISIKFL